MAGNKDKNEKYQAALEKCEQLIINTRKHLEYNKKMLRCYERKKRRLTKLLEEQKYDLLREAIDDQGFDIDELCKALKNGKMKGFKRTGIAETEKKEDTADTAAMENNENTEDEEYGNSEHFEDTGSAG